MPGKVRLLRADGTVLEATPEQASRLALLGYKEQTPEAEQVEAGVRATEDYYTSPGQKLATGLEGFGAGATFGATDYLLGDEDTKARAFHNPGTRLGTELLGAIAPMFLTDGAASAVGKSAEVAAEAGTLGKAARFAPTNLLTDAAKALAPGAPGSLTNAVVRGAIEGGVYGGAGAADHTYLDGDPVTAEAVLHGLGWGTVIGGAFGAAGHGLEAIGKKAEASVAAKEAELAAPIKAEAERVAAKNAAEVARYEAQLAAAKAGVKEAVPVGALRNTAGAEFDALGSEIKNLTAGIKQSTKAADAVVDDAFNTIVKGGEFAPMDDFGFSQVEFIKQARKIKSLYDDVGKAVERGKFDEATEAAAAYSAHVSDIAAKIKVDMPNPGKALNELITSRRVADELSGFPRSVEEFARMSPGKMETTLAALEKIKAMPYDSAPAAVEAATNFSKALGIEGQDLRSTWRAAQQLHKSEGSIPKEIRMPRPPRIYEPKEIKLKEPKEEEPGLVRKALGYVIGGKAYVAARAVGAGRGGALAAYAGVKDAITHGGRDLVAVRAASTAKIKNAAASYLPKAGAAVKRAAPTTNPLTTTLFGEQDRSTKDKQQLAMNRVKEINDFAPTASDSIFRAIEPLAATQPALAPALHASALTAFMALQELAPKDPGVLSKLKSIWKPSDLQAAILGKQLEVFRDPVGEASLMLESGGFDPIKVEALKKFAPETWGNLRVSLLERITQPGVMDKISYRDQIGLSTMLDIPIHSSMAPEYIATSQEMFLDRSAPLVAAPRQSQNGGIPTPENNPNSTSAQKSTAR